MEKLVLIAMGGESTEHDISVITGLQAFKNMDRVHYSPMIAYLKGGVFYCGKPAERLDFYRAPDLKKLKKMVFFGKDLYLKNHFGLHFVGTVYSVLMCFHGGAGEDGSAQGFFRTLGLAQTSADVFCSAVLMDKCATKVALKHLKIDALNSVTVDKTAYLLGKITVNDLVQQLGLPIIIKPAHLGSSIGISVAKDTETLVNALDSAFLYDKILLAEPALENFFELNIALYRAPNALQLSEIERPVRREAILDFADKYLGGSAQGMEGLSREVPADISPALQEEVERTATKLYEALNLSGVVRIDYLYDITQKKLYFNEANTIPGSLATYLFRNKKKTARRMITELIESSVKLANERAKLITSFPSTVFERLPFSIKK